MAVLIGMGTVSDTVHAERLGRNRVLWDQFEFQALEAEPFLVRYYPPGSDARPCAAGLAERWYQRRSPVFTHQFTEKKPLVLYQAVLYQGHAGFQQTVELTSDQDSAERIPVVSAGVAS